MDYVKLGNTGIDVSKFCLGAMSFGSAEGWAHNKWALDEEKSKSIVKKALDLGAKHFEFDVQITSDNKYVVFHDYTLERTSNGKGKLSDKTLLELKKLDIGSWYSEEFSGEQIMTLKELIEFFPKTETLFLN